MRNTDHLITGHYQYQTPGSRGIGAEDRVCLQHPRPSPFADSRMWGRVCRPSAVPKAEP